MDKLSGGGFSSQKIEENICLQAKIQNQVDYSDSIVSKADHFKTPNDLKRKSSLSLMDLADKFKGQ